MIETTGKNKIIHRIFMCTNLSRYGMKSYPRKSNAVILPDSAEGVYGAVAQEFQKFLGRVKPDKAQRANLNNRDLGYS